MQANDIKALQQYLSDQRGKTELIETHVSWILLGPKIVYKIPKPVTLTYLDFGTLDQRKWYCQQELELNAPLASSIYQAVLPIWRSSKQQVLLGKEANGQIINYAIHCTLCRTKHIQSFTQTNII